MQPSTAHRICHDGDDIVCGNLWSCGFCGGKSVEVAAHPSRLQDRQQREVCAEEVKWTHGLLQSAVVRLEGRPVTFIAYVSPLGIVEHESHSIPKSIRMHVLIYSIVQEVDIVVVDVAFAKEMLAHLPNNTPGPVFCADKELAMGIFLKQV